MADGLAVVTGVAVLLAVLSVVIHHEAMLIIRHAFLPRFARARRWHVPATVVFLMGAHIVEVVLFALAFHLVSDRFGLGGIGGEVGEGFEGYLYYSFVTYTSLGLGDVFPRGHLRLLSGVEALTGLLMIGWTASFLLIEMRAHWDRDEDGR